MVVRRMSILVERFTRLNIGGSGGLVFRTILRNQQLLTLAILLPLFELTAGENV